MSKKHFIALANAIRAYQATEREFPFNDLQLSVLARFCASQNPQFNRSRWYDYIAGKCGPNGGAVKGE